MRRICVLPDLSAESHRPHELHSDQRVWIEKNCYADVWIELLGVMGLEPRALMPFTLAIDFEGDQWTFFKPPHTDLRLLYGIDVQELNVWRPLLEHAVEHLSAGKLLAMETDSHWLPDTAGTDYQQQHAKTTIVLNDLDPANERLGYFHNAGYFELQGEDFRRLFQLQTPLPAGTLPLYAELIRLDRLKCLPEAELARLSADLLREHVARRPGSNPVRRFALRLMADLPLLQERGLTHYHLWAFSTVRQLGAAFDLAADHLRWLACHEQPSLVDAAAHFDLIAQDSKALILKLARVINAKRPFDIPVACAPMAQAWDDGMGLLDLAHRSG